MNKRKLYYLLHNGKNSNLAYFIKAYLREYTPKIFTRPFLEGKLKELDNRPDKEYILDRVNYYNKLTADTVVDQKEWDKLSVDLDHQLLTSQKVYYFDAMEHARFFPGDKRWRLLSGDITYVPEIPSIVKSRPLTDNSNSVILNMEKVRHFLFVNDTTPWNEKDNKALFRGDLGSLKPNRDVFMRRWYGHPMVDAGMTNYEGENPDWHRDKLTIGEHFKYKFIMSLEGNDVASNLKWVMSSNCVAVTPKHTCETWFMEGRLIPNYHYIEVKDDFSDLEEKMNYYIQHPDEAQAIINHAHAWIDQFRDKQREQLISLLVLKKYFELTPQPNG